MGKTGPDNRHTTIHFSLDGVEWEIDLAAEDAAAFRAVLAFYAAKGRTSSPASARARARRAGPITGSITPSADAG